MFEKWFKQTRSKTPRIGGDKMQGKSVSVTAKCYVVMANYSRSGLQLSDYIESILKGGKDSIFKAENPDRSNEPSGVFSTQCKMFDSMADAKEEVINGRATSGNVYIFEVGYEKSEFSKLVAEGSFSKTVIRVIDPKVPPSNSRAMLENSEFDASLLEAQTHAPKRF